LLLLVSFILLNSASAQPGNTCSTAEEFSGDSDTCVTDSIQTGQVEWFSFNASNDTAKVVVTNLAKLQGHITRLEAFTAPCPGTGFGSPVTASSPVDSLVLNLYGLDLGMKYFIKITRGEIDGCRSCQGSATYAPFSLCLKITSSALATCNCSDLYYPPDSTNTCQAVCNGGFDLYKLNFITDPVNGYLEGLNGITHTPACPWRRPLLTPSTPDLFNNMSNLTTSGLSVDVPNNAAGSQSSALPSAAPNSNFTGYAGIVCYDNTYGNSREYITAPLNYTLLANKIYKVSFKVSLAEKAGYAMANLGAYLSSSQPSQPGYTTLNVSTANLQAYSSSVITNTAQWVTVSDTFVATGNESWITIGQFTSDASGNPTAVTPSTTSAVWNILSYYYIDDVSVTPWPDSLTVTASPNPLCNGDTVELIAHTNVTGAYYYTWLASPAAFGALINNNNDTVYANPTSGDEIYTCTIHLPNYNGCTIKDTVKVDWQAGPLWANAGNDTTLCFADTLFLAGTVGAPQYTDSTWWTDSTGTVICASCFNDTVLANPPTYYVFHAMNTNSGCDRTDTLRVKTGSPAPAINQPPYHNACDSAAVYCPSAQPTGSTFSWSVTDQSFSPVSFTNLSFNCIQVDWGTTTSGAGGYVILEETNAIGCTASDTILVYSCCKNPNNGNFFYNDTITTTVPDTVGPINPYFNGTIWINGDLTIRSSNLNMGPNSRIEVIGNHTLVIDEDTVWAGCCIMWNAIEASTTANKIIVTKSYVGDAVRGVVSNQGAPNDLKDGNTFNRNLVSATINPYTGTYGGIIRDNDFKSVTATNCPGDTLLPPYNGQKPQYGIYAADVGFITVGDPASLVYMNTFEDIHVPIRFYKTSGNVFNAKFKNIDLLPTDKAIWARGKNNSLLSANGLNTLQVGGLTPGLYERCIFEDCANDIWCDTNMTLKAYQNHSSTPTGNPAGRSGITVNYARHLLNVVDIARDTILDKQTFIYGYLNVRANTSIRQNYFEVVDTTYLNASGIILHDVFSTFSSYNIYNNEIYGVKDGIRGHNIRKPLIDQNRIELREKPNATGRAVWLTNNTTGRVTNNAVTMNAQTNVPGFGGIYISGNPGGRTVCNVVEKTWYGIEFLGTATSSQTVFSNQMSDNIRGIWLANGAVVGQQGSSAVASDNQWLTAIPNRFMSTGNNPATPGASSPFYYRPTGANYAGTPSNFISPSFPVSTFTTSSNPSAVSCAYVQSAIVQQTQRQAIAQGTLDFGDPLPLWIAQQGMYHAFRDDTTLLNGDSLLIAFRDSADASNMGALTDGIEDLSDTITVYPDALAAAASAMAALTPVNNPEMRIQSVMNIAYACEVGARPPSAAELNTLREIAQLCPFIEGPGVYLARTLLAPYDTTEYENTCEQDTGSGGSRLARPALETVQNSMFNVYPNPNNGEMIVQYELKDGQAGQLEIFTVTGQKAASFLLVPGQGLMNASLKNVDAGVYLYRIYVNGEVMHTSRLVIIK